MGSYIGSTSASFEIVNKQSAATSGGSSDTLFTGTWGVPVSEGVWNYDAAADKWTYTADRRFTNTWGYIMNPYASDSQHKCDWFYFNAYGYMLTGWQWIKGNDGRARCYYLNPNKDNTLGACLIGPAVTPDGYTVDENGAWTVDGKVVVRD